MNLFLVIRKNKTAGKTCRRKKKGSGDVLYSRIDITAETVFSNGKIKPVDNQITELFFEY